MNNSHEIVQVPFRGGTIDAVKTETGEILVNPIRICDSLGINWDTQRKKLSASEWATTVIMTVVAQDGRLREVTMIPLMIVPMWMSHINSRKVRHGTRAMLVAYQLEVVQVLSAWFLGVSSIPGLADEMKMVNERLAIAENKISGLQFHIGEHRRTMKSLMNMNTCTEYLTLREFVDRYEVVNVFGGRYSGKELASISRSVTKLSKVMKAEIRDFGHPRFSRVKGFRLDILQGWRAVSNISVSMRSDEEFAKLSQGRLFI